MEFQVQLRSVDKDAGIMGIVVDVVDVDLAAVLARAVFHARVDDQPDRVAANFIDVLFMLEPPKSPTAEIGKAQQDLITASENLIQAWDNFDG